MKKTIAKISDLLVFQWITKQAIRFSSPKVFLYPVDYEGIVRFEKKLLIR